MQLFGSQKAQLQKSRDSNPTQARRQVLGERLSPTSQYISNEARERRTARARAESEAFEIAKCYWRWHGETASSKRTLKNNHATRRTQQLQANVLGNKRDRHLTCNNAEDTNSEEQHKAAKKRRSFAPSSEGERGCILENVGKFRNFSGTYKQIWLWKWKLVGKSSRCLEYIKWTSKMDFGRILKTSLTIFSSK